MLKYTNNTDRESSSMFELGGWVPSVTNVYGIKILIYLRVKNLPSIIKPSKITDTC